MTSTEQRSTRKNTEEYYFPRILGKSGACADSVYQALLPPTPFKGEPGYEASARDVNAALKFYHESRGVLRDGGFNLRKFMTNVPELQQFFEDQDQSTPTITTKPDCGEETYAKTLLGGNQDMSPKEQKVLGVRWNVTTDCLVFSVQEIAAIAENIT